MISGSVCLDARIKAAKSAKTRGNLSRFLAIKHIKSWAFISDQTLKFLDENTMDKTTNQPKIAVIGGGPGGLILARVLKVNGLQSTVFELDAQAASRDQGGTLDMHPESGQMALKAAQVWEEFQKFARYEADTMKLLDKTGKIYLENVSFSDENGRPEIDRLQLRNLLLNSLEESTIRWDQKVQKIIKKDDFFVVVTTEGESEPFDIVVGADGAWSKVRAFLSTTTPEYTDLTFGDAFIPDIETRYPDIATLVGGGTMAARESGISIFSQLLGDGSVRSYFILSTKERDLSGLTSANSEDIQEYLLQEYADWNPSLKKIIEVSERFILRPLYVLPVGYRWESQPGITLVGDAAHLLSFFGGQGANLAMQDGAELALAIAAAVHNSQDVHKSIKSYEEQMWKRADMASKFSNMGIQNSFANNPAQMMMERFKGRLHQK
ncbi:hypothetical protein NQZ79_g7329 [Umbelopsis isabellina]|nr:hypothetical protein NQZ79_g7329 [Umbelopsis isabellina]